jgi:phosphatidylserine/phosphatidylglycerophosphate/cardiolipin synthase-like enzyme
LALGPGILPEHVLVEPQDGVHSIIRALDKARDHIFLETYILTDARVIHALERAAAQGVGVYVLLEQRPLGMGSQPERLADMLRAAGVFVRWTPPRFYLTHAKFLLLDDRMAVVSTANFSRSAFS